MIMIRFEMFSQRSSTLVKVLLLHTLLQMDVELIEKAHLHAYIPKQCKWLMFEQFGLGVLYEVTYFNCERR